MSYYMTQTIKATQFPKVGLVSFLYDLQTNICKRNENRVYLFCQQTENTKISIDNKLYIDNTSCEYGHMFHDKLQNS